ncbi:MAG: right-handed parallel beta-helix repeat-containing protein [Bacteroidota bacterium]
MKGLFTACCILFFSSLVFAGSVELKAGMVIKTSITITTNTYYLNAVTDLKQPLLVIEGNDITVDFNQSVLQGSVDKTRPDEFYGLALLIKKGSKNITIKNAAIHGYKIAIMADGITHLTITNCDLGYNWRQHLQSNREREDISDWLSYHKNENDEWMRYGAAMYLKNCRNAVIKNNTVTGGQCALMLTGCEKAEVSDNDFSFNSGIGIGLYRSSNNSIYHNRLDYNVRGFSNGKYNRGQDSAAILVFEQSSNNIFALNTATHSGDGFFLWAGQTTMDTGEGGCNDNFIYGNDFSYAPTNGIEITFSRNLVMKNIVKDCDHGIWGGYSFDTDITDNSFENNRIGIAIEHGQNINIALNGFNNDQTGIKLWSREKQPDDWIYAKKRNTESRNYWIAANRFTSNKKAFDIMGTDTVVFSGNSRLLVEESLVLGDRVSNIDTSREDEILEMEYQKDERLKTIKAKERPTTILPQGKAEMRITEWGPYDFRYPLVWLKNVDSNGLYHFEILGPKGNWEAEKMNGFTIIEKGEENLPSFITAKADSNITERSLRLIYKGASFTDQFGKRQDSGKAYHFAYKEFDPKPIWNVSWYQWNGETDPGKEYDTFTKVFDQQPVLTSITNKIDYTWWGAIGKGLPADSFATVAITRMELPENTYRIGITADDYVKLFVDEKELINAWDSKYTDLDENTHHRISIRLSKGSHSFKIVHAEKTGLATLNFYISPE